MKNEIPIDWRWTFKICIVWFTVGFDSLIKFLKRKRILRGHTDLNHGPIGLQPIALPLSYIPKTDAGGVKCSDTRGR